MFNMFKSMAAASTGKRKQDYDDDQEDDAPCKKQRSFVDLNVYPTGQMQIQVYGGFFTWMAELSPRWVNAVKRWWGGKQKFEEVNKEYKAAMKLIVKNKRTEANRQLMLQDRRDEFVAKYPEYEHRFKGGVK